METKTMLCKRHGEVEYRLYKDGDRYIWRCPKCATMATQKRRENLKLMSIQFKGGKCQKCGYDKCISALEFHHINPDEKEFGIGAKGYTHSWEETKKELEKCVLVCANCHREIHCGLINVNDIPNINDEDGVNRLTIREKNNIKKCIKDKVVKKENRPSKEELRDLIKTHTFVDIGRIYGVTDNSVRKWCKKYDLPYRKTDVIMMIIGDGA